MKLWTGRISAEADSRLNDFNSSIPFDSRLYAEDIEGSKAHAAMLGERGIIPPAEAASLVAELDKIKDEIDGGNLEIDKTSEDIHTFIESELIKRLGDTGRRLHTGRSRNDQVATDLRMWCRREVSEIKGLLAGLCDTLLGIAQDNLNTVMPGTTHLQPAQPVTLAHHLMAYTGMFLRDLERLSDCQGRINICPLGSGALAGVTYPIDRNMTAAALGFSAPCENSADGVSDRDFAAETLFVLGLAMIHLSRLCEELILWSHPAFGYVEIDDAFATGSSIMPQKKNPDIPELVRGKTGRVIGSLNALLLMLKGLPLAYNKDMQEDKEPLFDGVDTARLCLTTLTPLLATLKINPANMRAAAARGFINATDCADYLTKKGLPFREAYRLTGQIVSRCIEEGLTLEQLPLADYRGFSPLFSEDIYSAVSIESCLAARLTYGGPAPAEVKRQIDTARKTLEVYR